MKKRLLIVVIVILVLCIAFKVFDIERKIMMHMYPERYTEYVDKYAEKYKIDREWIFALIKAESNFETQSISQSGAIGLMQLMEDTAIEVSNKVGLDTVNLTDADTNIELGTKYFSYLVDYYKGNYNLAITAYNAGIGTVAKWIDSGIIKEDGSDIENIPYKETNNYVRKILKNYDIYKKLYG